MLNNADRLPGTRFWKYEGNEGNFLFGDKPGEVYSIDQCVIVKMFQETYAEQVRKLLLEEYLLFLSSRGKATCLIEYARLQGLFF